MQLDRRTFLQLSTAAMAATPFARLAAQTRPPVRPPITAFTDLRRNIGIFTGRGGTIGWLINPDAVIAVDTQYPDSARICVDALKQKAGRGFDVVINTHHHIDHTGGNGVFKADATHLVAQAHVLDLQKMVAAQTPNAAAPVLADVTFEKEWTTSAGDEQLVATYFDPAHTGADAIVHFVRANVVHMGDLIWIERHPRVDRAAGASIQSWMKVLERIEHEMPADAIFIAGHAKDGMAPTTNRAYLLRQRDYFDRVLSTVRKGIAAGHSKDAITAAASLGRFYDFQASPGLTLADVVGVAYDELTGAH
ncbi:MAG TPA: MBL fold metallo-hydrolase [Vicinamibacterales bacterium]|jgi:glyoxylase-like metal-dependent hydrolase (beta-lactamase superfamily II)